METPAMGFVCTCGRVGNHYTESEKKIAEVMSLPVEWLHNFMDNWEEAYDEVHK